MKFAWKKFKTAADFLTLLSHLKREEETYFFSRRAPNVFLQVNEIRPKALQEKCPLFLSKELPFL